MDKLFNYLPLCSSMGHEQTDDQYGSDVKRAEFIAEMMQFNADMLVFVDETGSDRRNSIRKFGSCNTQI